MIRKLTVLAAVWLALMLSGAVAAFGAPSDYPAPPVPTTETQIVVSSATTPTTVADVVAGGGSGLASTGAGFNVGMTVAIAALILVAGLALTILGARRVRSK